MQNIIQFVSSHPMLCSAWIILFITLLINTLKGYLSKVKKITRAEATCLINQEGAVIIDTRPYQDFCKGHLVNALNVNPVDIRNGILNNLAKYKYQPVIIVCTHGIHSRSSGEHLVKAGFQYIYTLQEGMNGWNNANLPLARFK
ncbi:rhodanese-like domain-containing protein [Candidatus Profftia tarda]|nr:rhodanese-like domain-containing protein [Candidatus Profftia tarda]